VPFSPVPQARPAAQQVLEPPSSPVPSLQAPSSRPSWQLSFSLELSSLPS
jgi:hypothetical protein